MECDSAYVRVRYCHRPVDGQVSKKEKNMNSETNENQTGSGRGSALRRSFRRFLWIMLALLVLAGGAFVYVRYYFVFGSGVKAGTLNYVVKKGYVFKTYEGVLIMEGFRTATPGTLQSNQFVFSVDDANLADSLMRLGGRQVELRYNEYLGALPWRGYSNFVVDEILSVK